MTQVTKRFYGHVTYDDDQKQTYVFVESNILVSFENDMYIIFHKPTKSKLSL